MVEHAIKDWPRPYFSGPAGDPFLYYVVYGQANRDFRSPGPAYRCAGVPSGIEIVSYGAQTNLGEFMTLRQSIAPPETLRAINPPLADQVSRQTHCFMIRGTLVDTGTLNAFRDVIGVITCLLDAGGVAVFDTQSLHWWGQDDWRRHVFDHGEPAPVTHVTLWRHDDKDGTLWLHTRGMRKFGRPDVSLRHLPSACGGTAEEMFKRLIGFQAFGGIVTEGQELQMQGLPAGVRCRLRGDMNDELFHNAHIELDWPGRRPT